jgi:excinuclease ABC subunit C
VPGIGPKTRTLLLKQFKSLKRIREADEQTLAALIGPVKARTLTEYLHQEPSGSTTVTEQENDN